MYESTTGSAFVLNIGLFADLPCKQVEVDGKRTRDDFPMIRIDVSRPDLRRVRVYVLGIL
jgi:hypothetical protein